MVSIQTKWYLVTFNQVVTNLTSYCVVLHDISSTSHLTFYSSNFEFFVTINF